jgi:predicted ATPase
MSHPFGNLVSQHLSRKHGLSQENLARGIIQDGAVISNMCHGKRLRGRQARERVVLIVAWFHQQGVLEYVEEANSLLTAAGMANLSADRPDEATLLQRLATQHRQEMSDYERSGADSRVEAHPSSVSSQYSHRHRHNLPAQPNSFVGRSKELNRALELLRRPGVRLLTMTGAGGVGKTRLALEVATHLLADFPDGIFFVALSSASNRDMVIQRIVQALGVQEVADRPMLEVVKGYLEDKRMLLLLDNFEQVIQAAPMVSELLRAVPGLKVLPTSRACLNLYGEHEFQVPPLALPSYGVHVEVERLIDFDAVALFTERATSASLDFRITEENASSVVEICQQLDCLPLAIELAAARVKTLSLEQIRTRLKNRLTLLSTGPTDLPERQQTLRNTIGWSYDLLDGTERALFRRLSVFIGSCTPEAAERVCNMDGDLSGNILENLLSLVGKSLLRQGKTSSEEQVFTMLETTREYAQERLEESHEADEIRKQHAETFLALAEEADKGLRGLEQLELLERLEREHDNLRAALEWWRDNERGTPGYLRLAGSLVWFWYIRGHFREGREWLEVEQSGPELAQHTGTWAKVLFGRGILAREQANYTEALVCLKKSVTLYEEIGDLEGTAPALSFLGLVIQKTTTQPSTLEAHAYAQRAVNLCRENGQQWGLGLSVAHLGMITQENGDNEAARAMYQESIAIFREVGDRWGLALALACLGNIAYLEHDHLMARPLYEESVQLLRELGARGLICWLLTTLGHVALWQEDFGRAKSLYKEALPLHRVLGNKMSIAYTLNGLGEVARAHTDYMQAQALYEESLSIFRQIDDETGIAWLLHNLGSLALHRGEYAKADALYKESLALFNQIGFLRGIAACLIGLAGRAVAVGEIEKATMLLGAVDMLINTHNVRLEPVDKLEYKAVLAKLDIGSSGEGGYPTWKAGACMTLEHIVGCALA